MFHSISAFLDSARKEAFHFTEDIYKRSLGRLSEGKERRFVFPFGLPAADTQEAAGPEWRPSVFRILVAMTDAQVLFQQALYMYGEDIGRLVKRTTEITTKNSHLYAGTPYATDFSSLSSLLEMNSLMTEMTLSAAKESVSYWSDKTTALYPAILEGDLEEIARFWERQVQILDIIVRQNPAATEEIRGKMGFRFNDERRFAQVAETERAVLYQVHPLKEGVTARGADGKPIMHLSPFILPENILDLLPHEGLSLVGAFANSGTPTYFIHMKDIIETPAVQLLTEEALLRDIQYFARTLHLRHGTKVTLSGTCQGALPTLHAVCAQGLGLESDVDAWVGVVPAYALASSPRVRKQMSKIPAAKQNLLTITERLPSGNVVVVGEPSALSSRLGNFAHENPMNRLIADMRAAEKGGLPPMALALRAYLASIRPMPLKITEMSHHSATIPITKDGVFPETLFGKPVSLKHAISKGIRLHVVAGGKDIVVDPDAALAMFKLDCIKKYEKKGGASYHLVEGAGHVALMTTCSREGAKNFVGNPGGPLWFHLKLETELTQKNS